MKRLDSGFRRNDRKMYFGTFYEIINSPVRAFRAVGGEALFVSKAKGSKIYDADGRPYIDYVSSWGPMILGHAHPQVRQAMAKAIANGWTYGAATALEVKLAQKI